MGEQGSISLFIDNGEHLLIAVAQRQGLAPAYLWLDGWRIDATPEQMRDILNDYCRAKIDAKNIESGQPLWVDVADKAQERRP